MMLKRLLRRDTKGIGAVEFALVAPVLISFVIGISQMGRLFYANADMKNALASGARVASVWPVPDDSVILAAVNDRIARTGGVAAAEVEIADRGTDPNGNDFIEIEMTYQVPLDFIFFDVGPVTLNDSRRVFTQMGTGSTEDEAEPPAGTTSTTSATSAGGTTSTSATSAGGTTSTSATSASSTGGDTTSTSATSAGGTTSTTSASSTTSSTTSGSSGNGNGNGNGHNHGNCKRRC